MNEYDIIATIYDRVMGAGYTEIYKNLVAKYSSKGPSSIIDFGSGTGNILSKFSRKNETVGIDSSKKMLEIAKKKDPCSDYYLGDIRTERISQKFDISLCVFDTINHLPQFSDWKKFFDNVAHHLTKEGVFIFDFNTLEKLNEIDNKPLIQSTSSELFIIQPKKISKYRSNWKIDVFERTNKKNLYKRYSTNILEVSFSAEKVKEALKKYFDIIEQFEDNGRVFIVSKKASK